MSFPLEYSICGDATMRCKGRHSTDKANQEGEYFGNFIIKNRKWALVLWDTEEEPDLYKAELLLVESKEWVSI